MNFRNSMTTWLSATVLFVGMSGCATFDKMTGTSGSGAAVPLAVSDKLPAAQGEVSVGSKDNNTALDLTVKHLAPPEKIDAQATTYMVWGKPAGDQTRAVPLGTLAIDKDLNAKIDTITPMKNFDLFVTAEPTGVVQDPSGERLLWANIKR